MHEPPLWWRLTNRTPFPLRAGSAVALVLLVLTIGCRSGSDAARGTPATAAANVNADRYQPPPELDDGWATASAAGRGLDIERLERMTEAIRNGEVHENVHAVLIVKDGRLVYEEYFTGPDRRRRDGGSVAVTLAFGRDTLHDVRSVGKSITSTLVGIAHAGGALPSLDTPLIALFPEHEAAASPAAKRVTLRHALTMSAGLEWNEDDVPYTDPSNDSQQMYEAADPVAFVLGRPSAAEPGQVWAYNSGLPALLGLAVSRAVGVPLGRYAREVLFEPLGIGEAEWTGPAAWRGLPELSWDGSRDWGDVANPAGSLWLRPRDLAKFGSLYLYDGRWNGRQVVPARWVRESTTRRIAVRDSVSDLGRHGYGYLWWHDRLRTPAGDVEVHTAVGNGGQRVFVIPSLQMVVVLLAGRYNDPDAAWLPERLLVEHILPAAQLVDGPVPTALTHDNREPAGTIRDGMLQLRLVAQTAAWYPEAEDGPRIVAEVFGEEGAQPAVPGPLVRVPVGTRVRASVRNALPDTLLVLGLADAATARGDTLRIDPGATVRTEFVARSPGTRLYYGATVRQDSLVIGGEGEQLVGALIVDPPGSEPDRVFVLTEWTGPEAGPSGPFGLFVNGKSWPYTERLAYAVGDTARWRIVNGGREHPMHLHGFHFRVDSRGDWSRDTVYTEVDRRLAVTELLSFGTTASLVWVPERAGRWLFHCHFASHVSGDRHYDIAGLPRPEPGSVDHGHDTAHAMAGLVLGIEVNGDPAAGLGTGSPDRRERLLIQERPAVYGDATGYGFVLEQGDEPPSDSLAIPGPPLVLTRGERTEIVVVNRATVATAVHWHGLELESYYDGVPGWSGDAFRTTPLILPGDSFTVSLRPPRAGTFIYHSHAKSGVQLPSGLYGPLIVLEPGDRWDPENDHVLIVGVAGPQDTALVVLNGGDLARLPVLRADVPQRLRLINITAEDEADIALLRGDEMVEWRALAKDGAPLPRSRVRSVPARVHMGAGETYDFELVAPPGELRLEVKSFNDFEARILVRPD